MSLLYEKDFYGWCQEQCRAINSGVLIDKMNLIEEIESMGRRERDQLVNRLDILITHLLKWEHQPDRRSRSWKLTIVEHTKKITTLLAQNPSLAAQYADCCQEAAQYAALHAAEETGLPLGVFPTDIVDDPIEVGEEYIFDMVKFALDKKE